MSSAADSQLSTSAQEKIAAITSAAESGTVSWEDANTAANEVRASENANYTVSSTGTVTGLDTTSSNYSGSSSSYSSTDYTDYLNDLYAAQTEAELAALTSA